MQGISHLQKGRHATLGIICATKLGLSPSGLVLTLVAWRWGEKPWGPAVHTCELSRLWGSRSMLPPLSLARLEPERE